MLIVTPTYWDIDNIKGGAERYVKEIADELNKSSEFSRVDVISFSAHDDYEKEINKKQTLKIYKTRFIDNNQSNPVVTFKSLLNFNYDIFYIHQFNTWLSFYFIIIGKILGKKIVLTDHNGGGRCYNVKLKLDYFIDLMLAGSKQHSDEMQLQVKKTKFIYGGVDSEVFTNLDIDRSKDVLFVGRLKDIKGLSKVIKILNEIQSVGTISFVYPRVSSSEEIRIHNELLFLSKNTKWNILLKENLDQESLVREYNTHTWTILPSINKAKGKESLGLVALEALSCGSGCVVSDYCGIKELINDECKNFFKIENDWEDFFNIGFNNKISPNKAHEWAVKYGTWKIVSQRIINALKFDL